MADEHTAVEPLDALLPPALKQILLLVGLAAAVAAGVALVLWSARRRTTRRSIPA